jgi:small-conductance mechanosensitive channel
MPRSEEPKPLRVLLRNLVLTAILAVGLFVLFTVFNRRVLHGLTDPEVLLLEAGAIVLVAWLVSASVTGAVNAVVARRGQLSRGHVIRLFLNLIIAIGAVFALFDLAGVSAESIFLGSAFAGIILGLAAQTVLANVFAGILLAVSDPFRPGDRASFISSSYGALPPSYPHEMMYPSYSGTIEDVGLIYTVLALDGGGLAKIPNSVVIGALVLQPRSTQSTRVRMTFPLSIPVATVEAALSDLARDYPATSPRASLPKLEVADVSAASWDAVVTVWSPGTDDNAVRDRVLRRVLERVNRPGSVAPTTSRPSA